mmetsp:Transcript_83823/g.233830  ORF Transcript_83823/g.233830 Transcript_83823/m.233830 type:complete len:305 (+) Transcript_83823:493-1407(+)
MPDRTREEYLADEQRDKDREKRQEHVRRKAEHLEEAVNRVNNDRKGRPPHHDDEEETAFCDRGLTLKPGNFRVTVVAIQPVRRGYSVKHTPYNYHRGVKCDDAHVEKPTKGKDVGESVFASHHLLLRLEIHPNAKDVPKDYDRADNIDNLRNVVVAPGDVVKRTGVVGRLDGAARRYLDDESDCQVTLHVEVCQREVQNYDARLPGEPHVNEAAEVVGEGFPARRNIRGVKAIIHLVPGTVIRPLQVAVLPPVVNIRGDPDCRVRPRISPGLRRGHVDEDPLSVDQAVLLTRVAVHLYVVARPL